MSAVVEAVADVFEPIVEAVGDIAETVVEAASDVVTFVADTAESVVQGALDDPIGTIAKIGTAIYAPYLLPVVSAVDVVAHGGDIGDALTSAAMSYVGSAVGGELAGSMSGTWVGDALATASEATGIESLATDVARGAGTAATQTASGLLQGQDVDDALTRGLTSGIGSTVGSALGNEIDTGSNIADRLIGAGAGAATTASLRGGDAETAAERAIAQNILGGGINYAGNELKSLLPTQNELLNYLPSGGDNSPILAGMPGSDYELTPNEVAIQQLLKSTGTSDAPVDEQSLNNLISSLYPDAGQTETVDTSKNIDASTGQEIVPKAAEDMSDIDTFLKTMSAQTEAQNIDAQDIQKVDVNGNVIDRAGNKIGKAQELGMVLGTDSSGKPTWITSSGEFIPSSEAFKETSSSSFETNFPTSTDVGYGTSQLVSEAEGDFPDKIINNADGSTTVIETDGSSRTFNVDGSVTLYNAEGGQKQEYSAKEGEGYDGSNGVDYSKSQDSSSNFNLGTLANSLLSGVTGKSGTAGKTTGSGSGGGRNVLNGTNLGLLGGAAGLIGGAASLIGSDGNTANSDTSPNKSTLSWNPNDPMAISKARAYGQQFVNPVYAAEGGLLSLTPPAYMQPQTPYMQPQQNQYGQQPQSVQPTMIPNNYTPNQTSEFSQQYSNNPSQNYNQDPNNSVNMYSAGGMPASKIDGNNFVLAAQKYGLGDDITTLNKIVNYVNKGMSVNQAAEMVASKSYAAGGMPIAMNTGGISSLGGYSDGGRLLKGPGDGMSDNIPATIAGRQPARLANEEFVIPADVVSHLGNGSSEAGAKVLYAMMEKVRKARTGNAKQGKQIQPVKYMPKVRK